MNKLTLLMKNKNFFLLWLTQAISQLSNSLHLIAFPLWIFIETGSASDTGILAIIEIVPILILSPFVGIIVDKYNRKTILLLTDTVRGLLVFSLVFIDVNDSLWLVYLIGFLLGLSASFFSPARVAIIKTVVKNEDLVQANSLLSISYSFSMIMGPTLGGVILSIVGYKYTFLINAISFFIAALGTFFLRGEFKNNNYVQEEGNESKIRKIFKGYSIINNNFLLKFTVLSQFLLILGTGANGLLFVLHLQSIGATMQEIGMYMSVQGIGMIVGAFIFPSLIDKLSVNNLQIKQLCLLFIGIVLNIFVWSTSNYIFISYISICLFGLLLSSFNISNRVIIQSLSEKGNIGRISAAIGNIALVAQTISIIIATILVEIISAEKLISIGGIIVSVAYFILIPIRGKYNKQTLVKSGNTVS